MADTAICAVVSRGGRPDMVMADLPVKLGIPEEAKKLVVFVHGTGRSRFYRNRKFKAYTFYRGEME